jgi:hypothetical protein
MREPSLRTSRLAIAGGFLAAVAFATGGYLVGRATSPRTPAPPPAEPPVIVDVPSSPAPAGVLRRRDLLEAAGRAADAFASGEAVPLEIVRLVGRRFELLIPFGCSGPAAQDSSAPLRWRYDEEARTLRVHVEATRWQPQEWQIEGGKAAAAPSVEAFWITRPWSSAEACPSGAGDTAARNADPVSLPGQSLAIGQLIAAAQADEEEQPARSFDSVTRVAPEELNTSGGFRVRLSGRIGEIANGAPVRCRQPAGPEQRPICLLGASFEELAVEDVDAGVLATWSLGEAGSSY